MLLSFLLPPPPPSLPIQLYNGRTPLEKCPNSDDGQALGGSSPSHPSCMFNHRPCPPSPTPAGGKKSGPGATSFLSMLSRPWWLHLSGYSGYFSGFSDGAPVMMACALASRDFAMLYAYVRRVRLYSDDTAEDTDDGAAPAP